ncbi:MAG: leishmanolysin-related zinc metalloendopeptidase [Kibdelosporangium sp.]
MTQTFETYHARADARRAELLAATTSPFTITVRFEGGLSETQMAAFTAAADRWVQVIVGDLPSMRVAGEVIDDVLILAAGADLDGDGGTLAEAGATHLRPATSDAWASLPVKGVMRFDTADLLRMQANGTLGDVIAHEMGHVLGISGFIWKRKGLVSNTFGFTGAAARAEYRTLSSLDEDVPLEDTGGAGTAGSHWRERVFGNELMTGFVRAANNPLSRLTVAALSDIGYEVDLAAAEAYAFPTPSVIEDLSNASVPNDEARIERPIPVELPADSVVH